MRRRVTKHRVLVAVALLALALFGVTIINAAAEPSKSPANSERSSGYVAPTGPTLALAKVEAIARAHSTEAGTTNPPISLGQGTLSAAMRTIDSSTTTPEATDPGLRAMMESPVYLVVMEGHFTLWNASVPPGDPAPVGSMLDLVLDAHTGAVIGQALPIPSQQTAVTPSGVPVASVASRATITVHTVTGTITGRLFITGGPPPGTARGAEGWGIRISRGSLVTAKATTGKGGRFTVHVAAGSYVVAGYLPQGKPCAGQSRHVVVRAGRRAQTQLYCSVS